MCYQKLHHCNYCDNYYPCSLVDVTCPSLNDDEDANMCGDCRDKLEKKLAEMDVDLFHVEDIKDILDD